jgi:hypothetical protein
VDTQLGHIARSFEDSRNGHGLWIEIWQWKETETTKKALAASAKSRKQALCLDTETTAGDYIHKWQEVLANLEEAAEPLTNPALCGEFLNQITDPAYKVVIGLCRDKLLAFDECTKKIREEELTMAWQDQSVLSSTTPRQTKFSQQASSNKRSKAGNSSGQPSAWKIPSIPRQFKDAFTPTQIEILHKWRAHCLNLHTSNSYDFTIKPASGDITPCPSMRARCTAPSDATPATPSPGTDLHTDEASNGEQLPTNAPKRIQFNKYRSMNRQQKNSKNSNKKSSIYRILHCYCCIALALSDPLTTPPVVPPPPTPSHGINLTP